MKREELNKENQQKNLILYQEAVIAEIKANDKRNVTVEEENAHYEEWNKQSEPLINEILFDENLSIRYDAEDGKDVMAFIESHIDDIPQHSMKRIVDFAEQTILPLRELVTISPLGYNSYKAFYDYGIPFDLKRDSFISDKVYEVYKEHVKSAKQKF